MLTSFFEPTVRRRFQRVQRATMCGVAEWCRNSSRPESTDNKFAHDTLFLLGILYKVVEVVAQRICLLAYSASFRLVMKNNNPAVKARGFY